MQSQEKPVSADDAGTIIRHLSYVAKYGNEINELAQGAEDPASFLEAVKGFVEDAESQK
ncbi:MAG: hypothetical protein JRN62_03710 [Nitrososphaerota archaeon]|nr:hypothetical protein [Nitrososphaerota archaeon]MDG6948708.1 hypothetical protein [Nitrososphaerota archaeon]